MTVPDRREEAIAIEGVSPQIDGGRFAVKRIVADQLTVEADIFADGPGRLGAALKYRRAGTAGWTEAAMLPRANDRWRASFALPDVGLYEYTIEAWREDSGSAARRQPSVHQPVLRVRADPERARYGAWYELFVRSAGQTATRSATFKEAAARLPHISAMGFDVLYLTPIHPIGNTNRKGPRNALAAGPNDPGSPWAIGGPAGGHKAIHPELGTLADFDAFVTAAGRQGMAVALDYALQCSPDHPYVRDHPDWFHRQPDGTIRFAENPPKRYEDIYPFDFYCTDRAALWDELKSIVLFWIDHGVHIFRVDNPHTKPYPFWEWLIAEVQAVHADVIFLAEAFTRPKVMAHLAKLGFSQSYTYFTWRNTAAELREYLTELTQTELRWFFRGNFFANTPDILHAYLQTGGRPAFVVRLALAATLSSSYGIFNGFELCEAEAVAGTEEYLDSDKYQITVRDWNRPGNIAAEVAAINRIRRDHPALHFTENLRFQGCDSDHILAYAKNSPDGSDILLIAVNLDPFSPHEAWLQAPLDWLGLPAQPYQAHELLTDEHLRWRGDWQHVRLDPALNPVAIWSLRP